MTLTPSKYQTAIYDFIAFGEGNAIVEAVAGSGKTTTGVEATKRVPFGKSHIFLAFNKSIALELGKRGVNGKTFHSLCFSPVIRSRGQDKPHADKLKELMDQAVLNNEDPEITDEQRPMYYFLSASDRRIYGSFMTRLVGLARNSGVGTLSQDTPDVWRAIVEYHDLELDIEGAKIDRGIYLAMELFKWSNLSKLIDFDDMLYFAVRDGIALPKFDFVFVDEAQDTNAIQRAIIRKLMKPTSRLIAVGDPAQAIYGFRGADSNALNMLAMEFGCKSFPLSVSYRCPTSVVAFARNWSDKIEPSPTADEGAVHNVNTQWDIHDFSANDLVVCRTTKPLVKLCYQLLQARIPARMLGREIGVGLKVLIKKMNAPDLDTLDTKLKAYTEREYEKAIARGQNSRAEAIKDKTAAVLCLIEGLNEDNRSIFSLLNVIEVMFDERNEGVTLATVHKAKGLEKPKVFWLNSSQCPSKWARQPWQVQQEKNICYVAATRAMKTLVLIEDQGMPEANMSNWAEA